MRPESFGNVESRLKGTGRGVDKDPDIPLVSFDRGAWSGSPRFAAPSPSRAPVEGPWSPRTMTDPHTKNRKPASAVLAVGHHRVEWFDRCADGTLHHGVAHPAGQAASDIATAAEEAWKASGGPRRRCVLAIDDSLARHELLTLAPVSRSELRRVFERKAAHLAGVAPSEVLYHALPMGTGGGGPEADARRHWFLVAMKGGMLRPLRMQLRSRGFRLRRMVSETMAAVGRAQQAFPDPDAAGISATVSDRSVIVTMTHGDQIVYRDRIQGDIRRDPTLATSLVQVIRSCLGFWKKRSRGEEVGQIVLLGMTPESGQLLSHAVAPLIPEGKVVIVPEEGEGAEVGYHEYLAAATCHSPLNPDLSFPLPTQKTLAGILLAILILVSATLGWILIDDASTELRSIEVDTAELEIQAATLAPFGLANRATGEKLARLEAHLDRAVAIGSYGVPLDETLRVLGEAFAGRAVLVDATLEPSRDSGREGIIVHGYADPEPGRVLQLLDELVAHLEADPHFAEVVLRLPDRLPETDDGSTVRRFDFTIEAAREGTE